MHDGNENNFSEDTLVQSSKLKFKCPNCGLIRQDDVLFLCNTCDSSELIEKEGLFVCPSCLKPGENFECMLCGSKEVGFASKEDATLESIS